MRRRTSLAILLTALLATGVEVESEQYQIHGYFQEPILREFITVCAKGIPPRSLCTYSLKRIM